VLQRVSGVPCFRCRADVPRWVSGCIIEAAQSKVQHETTPVIPDYQAIMLPLLRFAADKQEHRFRDAVEALAEEFNLTDEEQSELLPSGSQSLFSNRVGWARTYLKQAGLLESPKRGFFKIAQAGLDLLR
jgi:restriction endonuclease Mrr